MAVGTDVGIATAGLDVVSGVFGYLAAQSAASVADSKADMVRTEAQANAQRYSEQAAQFEAQEKVMYLASGVKLSGSPVDVLATTANTVSQHMNAILMAGEVQAQDEQIQGVNEQMKGRDALLHGITSGAGAGLKGYGSTLPAGKDATGLDAMANMLSSMGR
jgi:hypothetical protein